MTRQRWPRNAGVSVMSALLGAAIGSVVVLSMMGFLSNLFLMIRSAKFRTDSNTVAEEIRALLSSEEACTNSFRNLSLTGSLDQQLNVLRNEINAIAYNKTDLYGDRTTQIQALRVHRYQDLTENAGQMTLTITMNQSIEGAGVSTLVRAVDIRTRKNSSGQLESCVALARMTDGLWRRSMTNMGNIYYTGPADGGFVGIGTDNPNTLLHLRADQRAVISVHNEMSVETRDLTAINLINFAGDAPRPYPVLHLYGGRGSRGAPQATRPSDLLGAIGFFGWNSTGWGRDNGIANAAIFAVSTASSPYTPTSAPADIYFSTSSATSPSGQTLTERMRITSEGNIGINRANPGATLHVHHNTARSSLLVSGPGDGTDIYSGVYLSDASSSTNSSWMMGYRRSSGALQLLRVNGGTMQTPAFNALPSGRVGIFTANPSTTLHVGGGGQFDGELRGATVLASSDRRLKERIRPLTERILDRLMSLQVVRFFWKKPSTEATKGEQVGLIAQEVEKVFPELVRASENGEKSIDAAGLAVLAIRGVQEGQKENASRMIASEARCQAEVEELRNELHEQRLLLEQMREELRQQREASR